MDEYNEPIFGYLYGWSQPGTGSITTLENPPRKRKKKQPLGFAPVSAKIDKDDEADS